MNTILALVFLLVSMRSGAADQYTQYLTYLDCGSETISHEHETNKIYEPAKGGGIESLAYSLDKTVTPGTIQSQGVLDKDGLLRWKPSVALILKGGWLAGSFSESYGGELVYIDEKMKATLLLDKGVLDIFEASLGIVVITRPSLLGNKGSNIYLLNKTGGKFKVKKLFTLAETPLSAWKLSGGDILINMKNASVVFTVGAELHRVQCENANLMSYRNG